MQNSLVGSDEHLRNAAVEWVIRTWKKVSQIDRESGGVYLVGKFKQYSCRPI